MRKGWFLKNSIAFLGALVSVCCFLLIMVSVLKLPDISSLRRNKVMGPYRKLTKLEVDRNEVEIGRFGEMMIEMLPENLPFTVFVPSEKAFARDLRLWVNDSLRAEKREDTFAVISRILGFSAVPYSITSSLIPVGKLISHDSISGFTLYISKDRDGVLVVNRIRSEVKDMKRGDIAIHIIDGVLMDAEFEQSVQPDDTEDG